MLELVKDYDCDIHCHLKKANMVGDTLSRNSSSTFMSLLPPELAKEIRNVRLNIVVGSLLVLIIQPIIYDQIKEGQCCDPYLKENLLQNSQGTEGRLANRWRQSTPIE